MLLISLMQILQWDIILHTEHVMWVSQIEPQATHSDADFMASVIEFASFTVTFDWMLVLWTTSPAITESCIDIVWGTLERFVEQWGQTIQSSWTSFPHSRQKGMVTRLRVDISKGAPLIGRVSRGYPLLGWVSRGEPSAQEPKIWLTGINTSDYVQSRF